MSTSDPGFQAALEEAKQGDNEGGVPIGACLVSAQGTILGRGHNMRMQKDSAVIHVRQSLPTAHRRFLHLPLTHFKAEISVLEAAGRLPASAYKGATVYTTLSPCDTCTGACILYKISRVVIGENRTFVGGEDYLKSRGIEVVNLNSEECEALMRSFIEKHPRDR